MTTPKIKTATAILLTGLLLAACSGTQEVNMAQEATANFHEMMSAGQLEQIYAQSDDSFKKATTAEDLTRFLSAMNRKLGVGFTPSGTSVTLRYATQFEHGSGTETFLYRFPNGGALLAGYHVNSNALMTN
jgi:hypothetical protein